MSVSRHCLLFLATDGEWYLELGNFEHHYDEEREPFTVYGGFGTPIRAMGELAKHSNPGSLETDDSGTRAPPAKPKPQPKRGRR